MHNRKKLNLGCGSDIREECVNQDIALLPGVDVVYDLSRYPYPFRDNSFDEIYALSVLEHLPDLVATMNELHRICAPQAVVHVRVPFWNSEVAAADPTHVRAFSERTFLFFDPRSVHCRLRHYYADARFLVESVRFRVNVPFVNRPYRVSVEWKKRLVRFLATYLCGIISELHVDLRAQKDSHVA